MIPALSSLATKTAPPANRRRWHRTPWLFMRTLASTGRRAAQ
jgi:hypothetical protein